MKKSKYLLNEKVRYIVLNKNIGWLREIGTIENILCSEEKENQGYWYKIKNVSGYVAERFIRKIK